MRSCFAQKLDLSFYSGLIFLVLFSIISLVVIKKSNDFAESIQKRQLIIKQLTLLQSYIKDAETGVRGFALTNDTFFLGPYIDTYEKANHTLDSLYKQLKTNSAQNLDLLRLQSSIETRFESLEKGLSCIKINKTVPSNLIAEGNSIMFQTSSLIEKMHDFEARNIIKETEDWKKLGYLTYFLIIITFFLSTIIAFLFWKKSKINPTASKASYEEVIEKDIAFNTGSFKYT